MRIEDRKDFGTGTGVCRDIKNRENLRRTCDDYSTRASFCQASLFKTSTVLTVRISLATKS